MNRTWLLLIALACTSRLAHATSVQLSFNTPVAGTIADKFGNGTGFTHRLPSTGSAIPPNDPNMDLSATAGHLTIQSTGSDFNGKRNLPDAEAPAIFWPGVVAQDFVAEALFRQVTLPRGSDQSYIYVGTSNDRSYRAGPHEGNVYVATKNNGGADENLFTQQNRFVTGDDLLIRVTRNTGNWQLSWNNLTNPTASGSLPSENISWLNSEPDLYFGLYIANAGSSVPFISRIDHFSVSVGPVPNSWSIDANGNWSAMGNWTGGIPNGTSAYAVFGAVITQPRVVTINTPITVARIDFDNTNAYTIAGSNPLTLETASGDAEINVVSGNHTIAAPLTLADNTVITVTPPASNLSITAMATSGVNLSKAGAGTLTVNNARAAGLSVNSGAVAVARNGTSSGTSVVGALSLAGTTDAWTAKLDLNDNDAVVQSNAASKAADFARLYNQLKQGFNNGDWKGLGITSATAVTNPNGDTGLTLVDNAIAAQAEFSGQPVTANSILLKYTYYGDIDQNGQVDADDLTVFASNFGRASGATQIDGDIDFNGAVNADDLTVFANNFGKGVGNPLGAGGVQAVPEPSTWMLLAAAIVVISLREMRHGPSRRARAR